MDEFFQRAIDNITRHGDTDIFPFPVENHILFDKKGDFVSLIKRMNQDVRVSLASTPPDHIGALAPAGYSGFRWASQLDPLWNAAYLGWVLIIAEEIEKVRIPVADEIVHSYRYKWDENEKTIFNRIVGWKSFVDKAVAKAADYDFVVSCDISEFYLRINHHRLEDAIRHLPGGDVAAERLQPFLSNFTRTYSLGLPIGGPASRLLSELVLNHIDSLLLNEQVDFIRFVDDYYIFARSYEDAFRSLVLLTRMLIENQGLQLQKSKTRIMSSSEFLASSPFAHDDADAAVEAPLGRARQAVMAINLYYDPYSGSSAEDYNKLKEEIGKVPIIDLIKSELAKSRVNISLTKKLINIVRHLEGEILDEAILTLVKNQELLYPVYFNLLLCAKSVWSRLSANAKDEVLNHVYALVEGHDRVMEADVNFQYAIRLLSFDPTQRNKTLFHKIFQSQRAELVGRDIIVSFYNWRDWHWLSSLKNRFRGLPSNQRRAFIIASFGLGDEGEKWRTHVKKELTDEENIVKDWASEKSRIQGWAIPL